ncbi:MAG TPA: hypothetical protein VN840_01705 [Streptosporangiaceae bacterium]|nr:hypothetical protein [Streptosporangiaceae bacterium]
MGLADQTSIEAGGSVHVNTEPTSPPGRPGYGRPAWISVTLVIAIAAALAGFAVWHFRAGPRAGHAVSWAPSPRDIGGMHAIATSTRSGYSLFTAHGTVRFLPGVDLGATVPGHQPGELAITAADYRRWLNEMGWLGIRAVRIYTIHPPAFYQALAAYDQAHSSDPIYLIQGVYLPNDDYLTTGNLYSPVVTRTFTAELRDAAAAVTGTLVRPPTPGHASGTWTANVSKWTAGWIIGVEWDPHAVASTNQRNPRAPAVSGRYFRSTPNANPTERWLAARMNDMAGDVAATGWTAPIAFANWPTDDPLHHPNEPNPAEDLVSVDPDHVLATQRWPGGVFASYHVYPYYPDFLRYQPSLQHFVFDGQADPYAAYLRDLRLHSRGVMPVMITEFGVPSSLGSAHDGANGWSQGDHTELQAMQIDARLLREIHDLGMAGAFVFEWTDEWYKKTWNTELHQIPSGRVQLWHDTFTNEQYFGLVATDPVPTRPTVIYRGAGQGPALTVSQVTASIDASYVYVHIATAGRPSGMVTIGLDTVPGITGSPPPGSTDRSADYALVLDIAHRAGQAWVRERLDPDQIDYAPIPPGARPPPANGWRPLELVTDKPWTLPLTHRRTPMLFDNVGLLRYGAWTPGRPGYDSLALWHLDGHGLVVRIPWAMAGISDPSSHQALIPRAEFRASSVTISGIGITITGSGLPLQRAGTVHWSNWQSVAYRERIKPGAGALRRAFAAVSAWPR